MTINDLLKRIDDYAAVIRAYRPLSEAEVKELDAYYRIGMTYSSNALEGNSLTLSETKVLLEDGITVGGKPIRDCYETTGHARAYDHMLTIARSDSLSISENVIRRLHYLFYNGIDPEAAGEYRKGQVFITGTAYVPPAAEEVPECMVTFVTELAEKRGKLHPVELAAYAHRRLVDIHPAGGDHRNGNCLGHRPGQLQVKAVFGAVRVHGGQQNFSGPQTLSLSGPRNRVQACGIAPPGSHDLKGAVRPAAGVDCQHNALTAKPFCPTRDQGLILYSSGVDRNLIRPRP